MPSVKASSRLDFGVIPNGDDFSVPQHPEQPVGPRVIPVRGPAMGNLRAALATVMIHASVFFNVGGRDPSGTSVAGANNVFPHATNDILHFYTTVCSGRALQCRCDTESDCKSCHEQCVPGGRENTRLFRFLNSHCFFLSFFVSPETDVFCVTQRIAIERAKRTGNRKFFRDC